MKMPLLMLLLVSRPLLPAPVFSSTLLLLQMLCRRSSTLDTARRKMQLLKRNARVQHWRLRRTILAWWYHPDDVSMNSRTILKECFYWFTQLSASDKYSSHLHTAVGLIKIDISKFTMKLSNTFHLDDLLVIDPLLQMCETNCYPGDQGFSPFQFNQTKSHTFKEILDYQSCCPVI